MDLRKEIARLIVEDKDISEARLNMIYKEVKSSIDNSYKKESERILIDMINSNAMGVGKCFDTVGALLKEMGLNELISIQKAGQILSSNGIRKKQEFVTTDDMQYIATDRFGYLFNKKMYDLISRNGK